MLAHCGWLLLHDIFRLEDLIRLIHSSLPPLEVLNFDGPLMRILYDGRKQTSLLLNFMMSL